jgi:putative membrane protein
MTRAALILLSIGTALFVALMAWQGFGPVAATFAAAGWGLLVVAAFHGLPLVLDAAAIAVLFEPRTVDHAMRKSLLARWAGESVVSLLPAGQIGGPVLMARHLAQHGVALPDAAAAITVSMTLQVLAQILFAIVGLLIFAVWAAHGSLADLKLPMGFGIALLVVVFASFYRAQRGGLFGRLMRMASTALGQRHWAALATKADAIDVAVTARYRDGRKVAASFALSFIGWLVGIGEVWLALHFLGHPVGWLDALLLESAGQAIRGAAFAIPGALGVQEGGYLLLAPLVGLPPEAALALSLAKRARELALGLPGIVYIHLTERRWQRRHPDPLPVAESPVRP